MGIDNREKRASSPNFWLYTIHPEPDGDISAADRIQVGGEYSGISAAWPAITTVRERIILAMLAQVAKILDENGYNTDLGAVLFRAQKFINPDYMPYAVVWPGRETAVIDEYGKINCAMPVKIECISEYAPDNISVIAEKMLGDITENVTGIDWTLPFTNGIREVNVGDFLTGSISGAIGYVTGIEVLSGSWVGGDASGDFTLRRVTAEYRAESLKVGINTVADTNGGMSARAAIFNFTGDLADNIEYKSRGMYKYPDDAQAVAVGIAGKFNIKYSISHGNPYKSEKGK